jgi:stage II sporulation protein M
MRAAFWLTLGMGVLGAALAYLYVDANIPVTALPEETVRDAMTAIRALLLDGGGQSLSAATLFWHNIRAELIMMAAGVFSFGVLGLLLFLGNFSLVGGVLAATKLVGLSPWLVLLAGVLPHGVIELPSVILAGAAMLYLGARLVTPLEGKSISETLIVTIADVLKVFLAVCVPLLLIAGLIEANITPRILLAVLGRTLEIEP